MAGDRTLKLSILGDVSNLAKSLNQGTKEVDGFGTQIADLSKKALVAFAAIGAAAGAMAVDLVKAAAEDEAARRKLEETIKSSTNATNAQIEAVSEFIDKTALATGVTDDRLRPALARLIRSTNDVEAAQKLLNLALDITAATGKPLQTVVDALGKAYDGNSASLGRLGLGVDSNILKGKDFNAIYQTLQNTFGTFAENEAATLEGKFRILNIAVDESKEAIGAALLPAAEALSDWLIQTGVPALEAFVAALTGNESVESSLTETERTAYEWGERIRTVAKIVYDFKEELIVLAGIMGTIFVVSKISAAVTATIALIKSLIMAYNALKSSAIVAGVASAFALNPLLGVGAAALAAGVLSAANALANKYDTDANAAGMSYNQQREAQIAGLSTGSAKLSAIEKQLGPVEFSNRLAAAQAKGIKTSGITSEVDWDAVFFDAVDTLTDAQKAQNNSLKTLEQLNKDIAIQVQAGTFVPPVPEGGSFDVGRFRMAEERGNTYNVTVNGALDGESVARQIVTILNESEARGTVGGGGIRSAQIL
jgi:hypothetical protein